MAGIDHYFHTCCDVPTFQNIRRTKHMSHENNDVGLAKWIIDDAHVFLCTFISEWILSVNLTLANCEDLLSLTRFFALDYNSNESFLKLDTSFELNHRRGWKKWVFIHFPDSGIPKGVCIWSRLYTTKLISARSQDNASKVTMHIACPLKWTVIYKTKVAEQEVMNKGLY